MTTAPQFFLSADLMTRAFAVVFERLADEQRRDSEHADYYESQRGCFERAQAMHAAGLYPTPLADQCWLMPSETGPAIVHLVERVPFSGSTRHGWKCGPTCKQRGRFHKHSAYLRAIEVAMELADEEQPTTTTTTPITFDDGTPIPEEPDPALEEVDAEPWLPGLAVRPPYRPAPMPHVPYARPRSSWQQRQNDEALQPWRSEERARLEELKARRAAA